MAQGPRPPLGRMTVRKGGGNRVRLWELDAKPGSTSARLEQAYLEALQAVDRTEVRHNASKGDPRFTPDGVRDDLLKFVLSDAVPVYIAAELQSGRPGPKYLSVGQD